MVSNRLITDRLVLVNLPAQIAASLLDDRGEACRLLGTPFHDEWPGAALLRVLPRQVAATPVEECFGVWVMVERHGDTVVGDIGFHGPPDKSGSIEIGYAVVPDRRGRGYAAEAAQALVAWALDQPSVSSIAAGCDPENRPSIRTLERVGFLRTGEQSGEMRWRYDPSA